MADNPKYRLTYFTTRGRAEPIRLLLTDAGIEFEDRRFSEKEWFERKESGEFPLNQIPILEADGKTMVQSRAIMRHLARKYGYNGKTEEEAYQIDVLCEALEDLVANVFNIVFSDFDQAYKDKLKESLPKTVNPILLKFLEKALEDNPNGNGYFVGQDATMVEFVYFTFIQNVVNMYPDALADYPKLRANRDLVKSREKISAYLAKQTPTYM
ncbi:S-crystallin SL11 [Strongylocentrotus purpuratus]|uniref:glutathione transferase n=1 Tax=Strongylocentrotus purpuratus TaxID=7668 RepID=A0A7M7HLQ9_STRPU|nr:S-crystallin SL11 [Strongylocentrotus purpuratus]